MPVTIQLNPDLSERAGGGDIQVDAATVRDALIRAARAYPSLHLLNCEGELRDAVHALLNGALAAPDQPLREGDTLLLTTRVP